MIEKMTQADVAKREVIHWLSHENELGKKPSRIKCTKNFTYLDMTYYIFKFKKSIFDTKWLLAVCGGYEGENFENCGHIFSEYKEYRTTSEIEDAIKIIEMCQAPKIRSSFKLAILLIGGR